MTNNNSDINEKEKHLAWYDAAVNAWINTHFEHDKSLLALSGGGIGLLITLMPGNIQSRFGVILYSFALFAFLVCIASVLIIFKRNANALEQMINNSSYKDKWLLVLDRTAITSFLLAVLISCVIGILAANHSYQTRRMEMASDSSSKNTSDFHGTFDSLHGLNNMRPEATQPKAQQTQPQTSQAQKTTPTAQQAPKEK